MNVTGNPGLAATDRFMIKKNPRAHNTDLLFFDVNKH